MMISESRKTHLSEDDIRNNNLLRDPNVDERTVRLMADFALSRMCDMVNDYGAKDISYNDWNNGQPVRHKFYDDNLEQEYEDRRDIRLRDMGKYAIRSKSHPDRIESGIIRDPYDGNVYYYVDSDAVSKGASVEHLTPLNQAYWLGDHDFRDYKKGFNRRNEFATDPDNMITVYAANNFDRGNKDITMWRPTNKNYLVQFVLSQLLTRDEVGLTVTKDEEQEFRGILTDPKNYKRTKVSGGDFYVVGSTGSEDKVKQSLLAGDPKGSMSQVEENMKKLNDNGAIVLPSKPDQQNYRSQKLLTLDKVPAGQKLSAVGEHVINRNKRLSTGTAPVSMKQWSI